MEFKEALRRRRESLGIPQEELARRLTRLGQPTSSADIQLWERGRNIPPLDDSAFRRALASAIQVPIEKLESIISLKRISSVDTSEFSAQALRAAELIDSMPEHQQKLALDILSAIVRNSVKVADPWA